MWIFFSPFAELFCYAAVCATETESYLKREFLSFNVESFASPMGKKQQRQDLKTLRGFKNLEIKNFFQNFFSLKGKIICWLLTTILETLPKNMIFLESQPEMTSHI